MLPVNKLPTSLPPGAKAAALALVALALPPVPAATTVTMQTDWISTSGARWIWPASMNGKPNQYVQVLHELELPAESRGDAELAISADTNYAVWMNGEFAGFGQWSDYPDDKTFDLVDLKAWARPGANRLCILAWYQGESSSQYRQGDAGLLYAVRAGEQVAGVSGPESLMRQAPDYLSGPLPRVSPQLSYTFEHHGEKDDGWKKEGYKADSSWSPPEPGEQKNLSSRPVRPRPIKKLTLGARLPMNLLSQGVFSRTGEEGYPAPAMQSDSLGWRPAAALFTNPRTKLADGDTTGLELVPQAWQGQTGAYLVLDAGREEAGLLDLELEAPEGTVVDIAWGEHLDDLRVRAHVGGRHFASRHVCGQGRQSLLHPFLRLAGRYLQLHITPSPSAAGQPVVIHYAGLRPTEYPVSRTGSFSCPDSLHNRIWDVSRRTLELCMHEHYEDCPWREQALYAMDARNQALAGYYCFGNYDFARASLDLLGKGMGEDGFLELCAPARVPITIPCFSLAWILALDDYLLFSGDRSFVASQLPVARRILETCARQSSGSLALTPRGPRMWNYYEWAPGMDGSDRGLSAERVDAPLNLFYLLALDAAVRMADACGESDEELAAKAAQVRQEFASNFWDADERAFRTRTGAGDDPHFAELTQALAILAGVVPSGEEDALRERLSRDSNGLVPCTLSHSLYRYEALLTDKERYAARVFDLISRDWGFMLAQGATSFWETIDGARAFSDAGSLCHGWSGIPAWFYGAYVLGVKPTAPGFSTYAMDPVRGVFDSARGVVPTPSGPLQVKWEFEGEKPIHEITPVRSAALRQE